MTTQDPLATLREAVDMLDYLWTAEGLVDGFAVRDGFAAADPLREDVPAVISRARAAFAATPPAIDPERGPRTEAGRMLAALGNGDEPIRPDDWLGIILDIEAQAAATPPAIDPERLTGIVLDAVVSSGGFGPIRDKRRLAVYRRISERIAAAIIAAYEAEP